MRVRFLSFGLLAFGILGIALFWLWNWIPFLPTNANFYQIHVGMTLPEAERHLGPAGPSYSSDTAYDYYIWKERATWVSVIVKNGRITEKHIRLAP